jgi:hypothetical protein
VLEDVDVDAVAPPARASGHRSDRAKLTRYNGISGSPSSPYARVSGFRNAACTRSIHPVLPLM